MGCLFKYKNLGTRLIAGLFLGVVLLFNINNVVYLHSHHLLTGNYITHAHPFEKGQDSGPIKSHHHSTEGFIAIQHLQVLFTSIAVLTLASVFVGWVRIHVVIAEFQFQLPPFFFPGRAPPSAYAIG